MASPGMLVQTRPLPPLTDRVVYLPGGPGPAVHLRQRADGSVLVGERTQETPATDPGLHHARALLAQAARFFPVLAGVGVDRWWLAYRAMPADRLPIVGPLPWLEGLYLAVSHSGVTLAPVLGRLIAGEVASRWPTVSSPPSARPASPSAPPGCCSRSSRCSATRSARTARPDRTRAIGPHKPPGTLVSGAPGGVSRTPGTGLPEGHRPQEGSASSMS